MILGLLRTVILTMFGVIEAYKNSPDRLVNWPEVAKQTIAWIIPVKRLWRVRPVYSTSSLLFHVGMLMVPAFLAAHTLLWRRSPGFTWPAIPQRLANYLTCIVIVTGLGLFFSRLLQKSSRALSRRQDYVWPVLLLLPFLSGYLCSNFPFGPKAYESLMFVHVYSANLIMLLIPFTKIAHCVLAPLSQLVTAIAWKFPAGAGDKVAATLGYADRPTWVKQARLGVAVPADNEVSSK
jgi:nitrate reductase gamma subunit